MSDSIVLRRRENINFFMVEVEHTLAGRSNRGDIVDEMLSLGSVIRLDDGTFADRPDTTD